MRGKISSVGGNFDSAVKLGRGIHEKYQCIKQLASGNNFPLETPLFTSHTRCRIYQASF